MKLQVNTSGAWRNVVDFPAERRDAVLRALPELARAIGDGNARWSIVDDTDRSGSGKREWLGSLTDALAATKE